MSEKKYLSPCKFAAMFGICTKTVYRQLQAGKIPALKIGGQWRVDMCAFMNSPESANAPQAQEPDERESRFGSEGNNEIASAGEVKPSIPGPKPKWQKGLPQ